MQRRYSETILVLLLVGLFVFSGTQVTKGRAETRSNLHHAEPEAPGEPEETTFTTANKQFLNIHTGGSKLKSVVQLNPPTIATNPGFTFSFNISVTDVTDLYAWQFKLKWQLGLLLADAENITEGSFLEQGGTTAFAKKAFPSHIDVGCSLLGATSGVDGSGTLATITLKVLNSGNTTLELFFTTLLNSDLEEISHSSQNGYFYTTWPVASFSYSPFEPSTGKPVTFNASASYDPDGSIVSCSWDFGDGAVGSGTFATHSYASEGSYTVTLQVVDDSGFSDDARKTIFVYAPLLAYISVPYHRQITGYYCGPASLEMVFDFYGPDIPQNEIAEVARTAPDGTYTSEMTRTAHFSNLSTSAGGHSEHITGYTARSLGYAAFECWDMTIDQLKSLIAGGYPIIVLTPWHYRVAVGYSDTRIVFQDSNYGENTSITTEEFDTEWDYSSHWALFVCPWQISVSISNDTTPGSVFNITASITYPLPPPFPEWQYPATSSNATITLPAELSLIPGQTEVKPISLTDLTAGTSTNITWTLQADAPGTYLISVKAEGKVTGSVPPLPSFPEPLNYEDRIGGFIQSAVNVASPAGAEENIQKLIEIVNTWNLPKGTECCLTSKLKAALHLLNTNKSSGTLHKLEVFMVKVQFLRGKKLTNEQANYLTSKTQETINLILD